MTTSDAESEENLVKMMTYLFSVLVNTHNDKCVVVISSREVPKLRQCPCLQFSFLFEV